jgi:hypothetical protein
MLLNKIIYDVREMLKLYTDDSETSDRYITHLYNIKRAKYLRQDLNNMQRTTDVSVTQTFCLGLEVVSADVCGVTTQCDTILRTKKPIPNPIELHTKVAITSVRPTNRISIPFNFVSKEKALYSGDSPFSKGIFAFLDNDKRIYLLSKTDTLNLIDCVTVTGVFEDPLDLINYSNCCDCVEPNTVCYDEATTDYPIQPHYIDLIKNEIVQELIKKLPLPEDQENNANDN